MNGWDWKILYRDLESWKNCWKKIEWNGMVEMGYLNKGKSRVMTA